MSFSKAEREAIVKELIGSMAAQGASFSAPAFAAAHGMTSTSVYRYLAGLERDGVVERSPSGKKNVYTLKQDRTEFVFPLAGLSEDVVWAKYVRPFLSDLPPVAQRNLTYAFTEILNNAIDHSEGTSVRVGVWKDAFRAGIMISDDGVGIFSKIAAAMALEEKSFAILELAKGKFTTDPKSHTGEGVFFSSRAVDGFAILSEDLVFLTPSSYEVPLIDRSKTGRAGTTVLLEIRRDHTETVKEVFDRFTEAPESYGFTKTLVPVRLLEYGDEAPLVISRSQAKRLMVRFERFENILLDFTGIDEIGQGFADELFRVFPSQHPDTVLTPINCSPAVGSMIARVRQER